jgi:hypothetical protein
MAVTWREKGEFRDGWLLMLLEMLMFPYQAHIAGGAR